jgi:hypothetical protein
MQCNVMYCNVTAISQLFPLLNMNMSEDITQDIVLFTRINLNCQS